MLPGSLVVHGYRQSKVNQEAKSRKRGRRLDRSAVILMHDITPDSKLFISVLICDLLYTSAERFKLAARYLQPLLRARSERIGLRVILA